MMKNIIACIVHCVTNIKNQIISQKVQTDSELMRFRIMQNQNPIEKQFKNQYK